MISAGFRQTISEIGAFIAFAVLVLFSSITKGSTRFFTWPWVLYGQILLLLPLFLLGWKLMSRPHTWRPPWTIAFGAPAVAVALSVFLSRRPEFSLEAALYLWSALAWCGLVAMKVRGAVEGSLNAFPIRAFRLAGAAMSVPLLVCIGLLATDQIRQGQLSNPLSFFRPVSRNLYPFGHWNYTGGYALLALSWFAALTWNERGRWRLIWVTSALIAFIALLSSYSRGAILGLAGALVVILVLSLTGREFSRRTTVRLIALAVLTVAGLVGANERLRNMLVHPASILAPTEGDVQRLGMLKAGGLLFQRSPWFGYGPGMTPFVYPDVRSQIVGGVETSYQLHNGPLELAVNSGVLGLLGWGLLGAGLTASAWQWQRTRSTALNREWKVCAMVSTGALAGYFILFFTDYQFDVIAILALLGVHAGIVLGAPVSAQSAAAPRGVKVAGMILCLSSCSALIFLIPAWRARYAYWSAWWETPPNNRSLIVRYLRTAAVLAPKNPYYLNQLAFQLAEFTEETSEHQRKIVHLQESRELLARSLQLDAAQEPVQAALGWLWLNENPIKAEQHFRAAIILLPDRDTLHAGLAASLLHQGRTSAAVRELAVECLVNPYFLASPSWTEPILTSLRPAAAALLEQDYATALRHSALPAWRKPELLYASAFVRWWFGGAAPSPPELAGATPEQRSAFALLSNLQSAAAGGFSRFGPLGRLYAAYCDPGHAEAILRAPSGHRCSEMALQGALSRLASHRVEFGDLLRAPAPEHTGEFSQRIMRGHYSIMHRIMDGPGYPDFAPRPVDAFMAEFVAPLFPNRGAIPEVIVQAMGSAP